MTGGVDIDTADLYTYEQLLGVEEARNPSAVLRRRTIVVRRRCGVAAAWHAGQSSDCAGFHLPKMVSGFLLMVTGRRELATRRANEAHECRKPTPRC